MHKLVPALAAAALAAFASTASAATGGDVSIGKDFTWSGSGGQGLVLPLLFSQVETGPVSESTTQCTQVETCDDTLIHVTEPGDLTLSLDGTADAPPANPVAGPDLDLYVYASDAQGTKGEQLDNGTGASDGAVESVALGLVEPGYYLAHVVYYDGVNGSYTAKANLVEHVDDPAGDGEDAG